MRLLIAFAFVTFVLVAAHALPYESSGDWVKDVREAGRLDQSARYADAQEIYDRILPIAAQAKGVLRAEFCNDLAAHYFHLARYTDAEALYQEAIGIWRVNLPDGQGDLALALGN